MKTSRFQILKLYFQHLAEVDVHVFRSPLISFLCRLRVIYILQEVAVVTRKETESIITKKTKAEKTGTALNI